MPIYPYKHYHPPRREQATERNLFNEPIGISFGKHKGKTVESLMLTQPDYIWWMVNKPDAYGPLAKVKDEILMLASTFDQKGLTTTCMACHKPATYCTVYNDNIQSLYWWCDNCSAESYGAPRYKLHDIRTYNDALCCVFLHYNGNKAYMKYVIRQIARAKGLSGRITQKAAEEFFKPAHP